MPEPTQPTEPTDGAVFAPWAWTNVAPGRSQEFLHLFVESMDWFKGNFAGTPHLSWEKLGQSMVSGCFRLRFSLKSNPLNKQLQSWTVVISVNYLNDDADSIYIHRAKYLWLCLCIIWYWYSMYIYNVYEYELLLCFIQPTALAKGWKNICQVGTNCTFNLRLRIYPLVN